MNAAFFAPRTIAGARSIRSRHLVRNARALTRHAVTAVANGCAAVVSAWRHHDELADMLRLDDRMLSDIGLTRGDVLAAVQEQRWTRAAWRLVATAFTRPHEIATRPSTSMRPPLRLVATRASEPHRDTVGERRAA